MHIIVTRNPSSKKLFVITEDDSDSGIVAEFETEGEANESARNIPVCQAWNYEVLEVSL